MYTSKENKIIILFVCLYLVQGQDKPKERKKNATVPIITKWLKSIHDKGYDKLVFPGTLEGKTTDVKVQLYVEHIGSFRVSTMDYEMDVLFVEKWKDTRLKHSYTNFLMFSDKSQVDRLWTPDIYFANSKTATLNFVMVPNMNIRIWNDGRVRLVTRISLKIACQMNLVSYPIDKQVCKLKMQTCASSTKFVNVTWDSHKAIQTDDDIQPQDLELIKSEALTCRAEYYNTTYSCLQAKFFLKRSLEYSLLQTYLPTMFIVMISWISFWIDPTSVPGRVGLALTTLLTLSTQAISKHLTLPPVGYIKAQDIWFAICLMYLFASLIEFAIVNMYTRLAQQELTQANIFKEIIASRPSKKGGKDTDFLLPQEQQYSYKKKLAGDYRTKAIWIDKFSRVAFPVSFLTICIIYWVVYLTVYYV